MGTVPKACYKLLRDNLYVEGDQLVFFEETFMNFFTTKSAVSNICQLIEFLIIFNDRGNVIVKSKGSYQDDGVWLVSISEVKRLTFLDLEMFPKYTLTNTENTLKVIDNHNISYWQPTHLPAP